jgi:hypothetical protein
MYPAQNYERTLMAMIIRKRARQPLARGQINPSVYPHGVGDIAGDKRCIGLQIDNVNVIITKVEWLNLCEAITRLEEGMPPL